MPTINNRPWQAITTRYLPPTGHRPARVKARTESGRFCVQGWDHERDAYANHAAVARALMERLGWEGRWAGGSMPDGYVFVRGS